jgi:ATP-dependent Clp protease ATP-binding subunit ClpC
MDDRYEFTEQAKKVLNRAEAECRRLHHGYIGTEHLLLGLALEGEGITARALTHFGIEPNKVRTQIEFIMGRGDGLILGEVDLTPRAKTMIDFAAEEAQRLKQHAIGTEHLLLGLLHDDKSVGAGVLASLRVNLEEVRKLTLQMVN